MRSIQLTAGRLRPLGAAVALAVALCSGGYVPAAAQSPMTEPPATGAPAASGGVTTPVTLQFPSWQQDEPGASDWYKAEIAAFQQANPGVTIAFTKVPLSGYVDKLTTEFAGNAPPQIVELPAGDQAQFISQGWLLPLDTYLAGTDILQNWPTLQNDACNVDGHTYCLLMNYYGNAWVYNSALLSAAGKQVPTTGDEYVDAVKAMTNSATGQFGTCFPTVPGFNMAQMLANFVIGAGGTFADANGQPTANTPEFIQGMTWYNDIVQAGGTPLGNDSGPCRQLLQAGKVASYFDGPWGQGFMASADPSVIPNLKATAVPFPHHLGGASFVFGIAAGIPTDQQDVTWSFLKSLTTPETQGQFAYDYGAAPMRQDAVLPADINAKYPYLQVWTQAAQDTTAWAPTGTLATHEAEFEQDVSTAIQKMITQHEPPDQASNELQDQLVQLASE